MQDVTALMSKLQANVSYLQFSDAPSEDRSDWPSIERLIDVQAEKVAADLEPSRALFSRYAAPIAAPGTSSRKLSDIFARLQG